MNARARVWTLLAHVPALVVACANGLFVWNHFYARGPYLHDSGWFSATVYRAGLFGRNPPGDGIPHYWGWHPSLLVTTGSLLSYVFPGDRISWYCVFQAMVYAPLAFAVPILVPESERSRWRSALLVAIASLAFAFGGQVVSAIGYPHFELFGSAGIAIMLAGLAMGRERIAWVGLFMSIATREDGGFHAAAFLGAVLAADFLGRPFPIPRRRVMVMFGVGFVATLVLMTIQKKCFVTVDAWTMYLAGKPPYAHLTKALLAARFAKLFSAGGFLWGPFVATIAIAALRRDPRYLLGWLVSLPWFALNICALQNIKGEISTYTGFPFVASAFWAAAYARACDRRPVLVGWRWPVIVAGSLALVSLVGLQAGNPPGTQAILRDLFVPAAENTAVIRAFATALREERYGQVRLDHAMTSWTLETQLRSYELEHVDAYAFFASPASLADLVDTPFTKCGRVARTPVFFCTTPERALPAELIASSPFLPNQSMVVDGVRRDGETIVIEPRPMPPRLSVYGPYIRFPPGRYVVTWDVVIDRCADVPKPMIHFDVARVNAGVVVDVAATPEDHTVEAAFEVPAGSNDPWELRTYSGPCATTIESMAVRRIARTGAP